MRKQLESSIGNPAETEQQSIFLPGGREGENCDRQGLWADHNVEIRAVDPFWMIPCAVNCDGLEKQGHSQKGMEHCPENRSLSSPCLPLAPVGDYTKDRGGK